VTSAGLANHVRELNGWRAKRLQRVGQQSGATEQTRLQTACPEVPDYRLADEEGTAPEALGELIKSKRLSILHADFLDWFDGDENPARKEAERLAAREGKKKSIKQSTIMSEVIPGGDDDRHATKRNKVDAEAEQEKCMMAIMALLVDYKRKTQNSKSDVLQRLLANVSAEEKEEADHVFLDHVDLDELIQAVTDEVPGAAEDLAPIYRSFGGAPVEPLKQMAMDAVYYVRDLFGRA